MPSTADLVAVLDRLLGPGSEEVAPAASADRVGLALDPPPAGWAEGFDAVVLHRSHGFDAPSGVGVVACHDPFDRALGLAHNAHLHADLGLTASRALGPKLTLHRAPADVADRVTAAFGGRDGLRTPSAPVARVAMADAMTAETVQQAVDGGADLYVTGAWRVPGGAVVEETGVGVLVVGHARQELCSLDRLARMLVGEGFSPTRCMR
jgi:putative NIF3 family GTP cyclohydrolase 1 type 2